MARSYPPFRIFLLTHPAESADVFYMKVIVQDTATGLYLAANGTWVAGEAAARDFRTLLRAFHFATSNVSCRFQVLLYSEDDDYVACIIEGEGKAEAACVPRIQTTDPLLGFHRHAKVQVETGFSRGILLDETRNHLN